MRVELELPVPPTVNHYWGQSGRRRFLTSKALAFRDEVGWIIKREARGVQFTKSVRLKVEFWFDTRGRISDLDNRIKSLQDSLVHAGLLVDDAIIDELLVYRKERIKGGRCRVVVKSL